MRKVTFVVIVTLSVGSMMARNKEPKGIRQQTYSASVHDLYTAALRVAMRNFTLANESREAGVITFRGSLSSGFCSYIAFRGTATLDELPNGDTRVRLDISQITSSGCALVASKDQGMRDRFANIFWDNLASTVVTTAH
jgi:hypothetical protein